jgi:4-hydroxy-4-methyl-2-oxoglutarate aldolase
MAGRPGFRVHARWPRPSADLLASFGDAASSQVADAMSRLGGMDFGVRAQWSVPRTIGAAVTVWCHAGDNVMYHKAVSLSQPGDILVINTQGSGNAGWGELLATSAMKAGIRGVIIDGMVRDIDALEAMRFPVWARGLSVSGCNKDGAGEVGAVIACGGVAVRPGDVIVADRDGATVVPLGDAAEVAGLAMEIVHKERKRLEEIARGVLVRPEIDETLRRAGVIE